MKKFLHAIILCLAFLSAFPANSSVVNYGNSMYGPNSAQLCAGGPCPIAPVHFGPGTLLNMIFGQGFSATMFTSDGAGGDGVWSYYVNLGGYAAHISSPLQANVTLLGTVLRIMSGIGTRSWV